MLTCRSAAKVNLTLDVLARRADGYHELQSVVHTIGLWDTLHFDFADAPGWTLRCNDRGLEREDNLCLQAARAWLQAARDQGLDDFPGTRITLHKNIPTGAGLGGGSGNAAATLLALNHLTLNCHGRNILDEPALLRVAARLGADVPLFLRGGCALLEGVGERLTPLPALDAWLVIVQPPAGLSTPAVYRRWDALGRDSRRSTPAMLAALQDAIEPGDLTGVANALHNDLSEPAQALGLDLGVDIGQMLDLLHEQGALGAVMTGSGSAVFGLFAAEAMARQAAARIADQCSQKSYRIEVVPFSPAGVVFDQLPAVEAGAKT